MQGQPVCVLFTMMHPIRNIKIFYPLLKKLYRTHLLMFVYGRWVCWLNWMTPKPLLLLCVLSREWRLMTFLILQFGLYAGSIETAGWMRWKQKGRIHLIVFRNFSLRLQQSESLWVLIKSLPPFQRVRLRKIRKFGKLPIGLLIKVLLLTCKNCWVFLCKRIL